MSTVRYWCGQGANLMMGCMDAVPLGWPRHARTAGPSAPAVGVPALGPALAQDVWRGVWRRRVSVNVALGIASLAYFLWWLAPTRSLHIHIDDTERLVYLAASAAYLGVAAPVAHWHGRRLFRPVEAWLRGGQPPTPEEAGAVVAQPWRQALASLGYWIGATAIGGGLYAAFDPGGWRVLAIVAGALLCGLHVAAIVYLLVERRMRPILALAHAQRAPTEVAGLGVRARFLLSWGLGSALSLAGIALTLAWWSGTSHDDIARAIWPTIALGFAEGGLLIEWGARSLTAPIDQVRAGLERVRRGELDVEVAVDDGGEIGLLQVGFNEMVSGLRERQRLRELFGRHVGADVARRALERGPSFGGEEVEASILFVDVIGYTGLGERLSGAEILTLLDLLFGSVVRAIDAEGGWVNKFLGDAAMCVFGAPVPVADHAARALRAAEALHAELARLAVEQPYLDAGIGVSSGQVFAGYVGTEQRHEFTVVGDAVNEASRLTEWAKRRPGRVLASQSTIVVGGAAASSWGSVGRLALRGRSHPTTGYEPLALDDPSARHPSRGRPTDQPGRQGTLLVTVLRPRSRATSDERATEYGTV